MDASDGKERRTMVWEFWGMERETSQTVSVVIYGSGPSPDPAYKAPPPTPPEKPFARRTGYNNILANATANYRGLINTINWHNFN